MTVPINMHNTVHLLHLCELQNHIRVEYLSVIVLNSFKASTVVWFGSVCFDKKGGKDIGNNGDANAQTDYGSDFKR